MLEEGLTGSGIKQIVFSGGDLVVKLDVAKGSPTFEWVEGLFENTFLKRYTRDRRGGKVPESLQLEEVEQVLNCGSWGEYATRRKQVHREVGEKGAAWFGDLRTDTCTKGEAASWFRTEEYPNGVNEHWLYHGTSLEGEAGISEGDFRLNLAGSNAGTLYGAFLSSWFHLFGFLCHLVWGQVLLIFSPMFDVLLTGNGVYLAEAWTFASPCLVSYTQIQGCDNER